MDSIQILVNRISALAVV